MEMVIEMTTTIMAVMAAICIPLLVSMVTVIVIMMRPPEDEYDDPAYWGAQDVDARKKLKSSNDLCDTEQG